MKRINIIILCFIFFMLGMIVDAFIHQVFFVPNFREHLMYRIDHYKKVVPSPSMNKVRLKAMEHDNYLLSIEK